MDKIFFDSWESIVRTSIICICAYFALVVMLRLVGNRTLSQLSAFDFIVTVALGSTLASVLLNKDVALADGILAFALLIGLQFSISWLITRSKRIHKLIKTEPFLLFYHGQFLNEKMRTHRITEKEVLQVVRMAGIGHLSEVDAVVLESNGNFSVIKKTTGGETSSLQNVKA